MTRPEPTRLLAEALEQVLAASTDPSLRQMNVQRLAELMANLPRSAAETAARPERWQDRLVEQQIAPGSSVLDLGCGGGELLARLISHRHVRGQGVELESEAVFQCAERSVPVLQIDLDESMKGFADGSFDYVVLEETLQTLHRPIEVLQEMLRVGRRGIVSFPNFGYWRVRLNLSLGGRMPQTENLPYRWHDTPNIHLFTLQDFLDWAKENRVRLVEGYVLSEGEVRPLREDDNVYAEEVLLVVEKT